ncbi:MAG: helix-turn-helix domain-containing protein [Alteromonas sp.]|jgi:predicted DNA-binding transcriptional regulator AlpA|uniref:helix-turn-helix transcriptional regulator n=1 Tax=Alteromonas sp. TaxID=232 RepID=UPI0032D9A754
MKLTKELITSKELARHLGIHEDNVRKSRATGTLLGNTAPPYYKLGYIVRYKVRDIETWVEKNRVEVAA